MRSSTLRKRILKQRGVELEKHTRRAVSIADTPASFPKTNLMKLLEVKFSERIDKLLEGGTIYEVANRLGVDASTISKWRKIINESFFSQFK